MGSLLSNENYCFICGKPKECTHHLIGGTSDRKVADKDGIYIPLCNNCHNMATHPSERIHGNPMAEKMSKIIGQLAWEKQKIIEGENPNTVRTKFIERYGKSYI